MPRVSMLGDGRLWRPISTHDVVLGREHGRGDLNCSLVCVYGRMQSRQWRLQEVCNDRVCVGSSLGGRASTMIDDRTSARPRAWYPTYRIDHASPSGKKPVTVASISDAARRA